MLTKKSFLKHLAVMPLAAMFKALPGINQPRQKKYLTARKCDQMIGLRLEWLPVYTQLNPSPGEDWEIVCKAPNVGIWEGEEFHNYRQNLFLAAPVGKKEPLKLMCFGRSGEDQTQFDLSDGRFYILE